MGAHHIHDAKADGDWKGSGTVSLLARALVNRQDGVSSSTGAASAPATTSTIASTSTSALSNTNGSSDNGNPSVSSTAAQNEQSTSTTISSIPVASTTSKSIQSTGETSLSAQITSSSSLATATSALNSSGTSTSLSTPTAYSSSNGVSEGAVAGAAVGCFVAGILIGLLGAFFILKRRYKRGSTVPTEEPSPDLQTWQDKQTVSTSQREIPLSQHLLEGPSDNEIAAEVHALADLVYQHVENNYHLHPVQISSEKLSEDFAAIGLARIPGFEPEAAAALTLNVNSRHIGLRHVISHVLFQSIDIDRPGSISMLPSPITTFLQFVYAQQGNNLKSRERGPALSQWRKLSALLLHPDPTQRTPLPVSEASTSPQAAALVNAMVSFLRLFIEPGHQQNTTEHLQAVAVECAKLGYLLFSHPADWRMVYSDKSVTKGTLVVCPGLEKVSYRSGSIGSPVRVVQPALARM